MNFSPKLIFYVTLFATIGTGIAGGTVHIADIVPAEYIKPVTGWISALTFGAMSFLTLATGYAGIGKGPLSQPPTTDEAKTIQAQAVAAAMPKKNP